MQMGIKKWLEDNTLYVAIGLSLIVAVLSLVSLKEIPRIQVKNSDKIGHIIAYTALGASWFYFGLLKRKNLLYIFILLVVYGIILEVFQELLTTYREADFVDMLANTLGIGLGWIIARALFRIL